MSNLLPIVSDFSSISLKEMDGVKLMSRMDTKFVFKLEKLPSLLEKMTPFYRVLEINGKFIHDYKSLYFDTNARKFYIDHHNSRVNRNKIRFREYVENGLTFLEVKIKNNKGRTISKDGFYYFPINGLPNKYIHFSVIQINLKMPNLF